MTGKKSTYDWNKYSTEINYQKLSEKQIREAETLSLEVKKLEN